MTKVRLITLGMLAVFAVSAVVSGSASAHRFITNKCVPWTNATIAWETLKKCEEQNPAGGDATKNWQHEEQTKAAVEGTSGVSKLEGEIAKTPVTIECKKDKFKGTLLTGGLSEGEVTFEECSIPGQGTCVVPNIKFKFKDKLIAGPEDEFEPETGTLFVEIKVEVCALKGSYEVKGTQKCKLPEGEVFKIEHQIECTPAGSSLTLGGKAAKFTSNEHLHEVSGREWAAE